MNMLGISETKTSTAQVEPLGFLMRMTGVMQATGLARSTIYKLMAAKKFPEAVHLTGRAVAWRRSDIETWTSSRPSSTH